MNAFLQFRLWARQGPTVERAMAAAAAVVALALFAWVLVPTEDQASTSVDAADKGDVVQPPEVVNTTTDAAAPATPGVTPASGSTPASTGAGGAPPAVTGGPATGAAGTGGSTGACGAPGASDQGVSASQIVVATTVFNVFGANSTINIQSADQQKQLYEALWDTVNKAGGVQCRKIVGKYYEMNPLDQNSQQSGCLEIIGDKPFAVVGAGGFFPQSQGSCIPRAKIPLFQYYGLTTADQQQFAPYIFSVGARVDRGMRTWVEGAKQQGFFDPAKGFKKLGLWETNCDASANDALERSLEAAGISGGKVSTFVTDCPISGQTPPNQCAQAVLQHSTADVSHVFLAAGGSTNNCYVNNAKRQGFKPRFSTSDYILGIAPPTVGETADPDHFDGALGITLTRFGHINAGFLVDPGSKWCNDAYTSHRLPAISAENGNTLVAGTACAAVQLFVAALRQAPAATRTSLVAGLAKAGPTAFSWPASDAVFDRTDKVTGGDFYRTLVWRKDCLCWKATTPAWGRSL